MTPYYIHTMVVQVLFNEYLTSFNMLDTGDKQDSHNPDLTQFTYCEKTKFLKI